LNTLEIKFGCDLDNLLQFFYFSVSESNFLAQIAAKEFWPSKGSSPSSTYKKEREKKKYFWKYF